MPDYLPIDKVLEKRRAQRHFQDRPLPEGAVEEILSLALQTPSGFNLQPWHITIVDDPAVKESLRAACFNQGQVTEAPVSLVISGDRETYRHAPGLYDDLAGRGVIPAEVAQNMKNMIEGFFGSADPQAKALWTTRQCALLGMTLMIVAESMGYNTCPMEGFIAEKVRAVLGIPETHEVVLVLPIGYGTGDKEDWGRLDVGQVTSTNRFENRR